MRLSKQQAEEVVKDIEKEIFDGIETKKIMEMILSYGKKHKKYFSHIVDLREALSRMRSKPDFEQFVALLLHEKGYKTLTNKIVNGRCIDHEIDVIAMKGNETILVEVKHHREFHTFTGLDTILELNSSFEDLVQGHAAKKHKYNFTRVMLVTNTKTSNHARKYAACREIELLGWSVPEHNGLEHYIHDKMFYPLTILKDVEVSVLDKLGDYGIFVLKQFLDADHRELSKELGIRSEVFRDMVEKAENILRS